MLEAASQVAELASTDEAFRAGKLTEARAQEITSRQAPTALRRKSYWRMPARTVSLASRSARSGPAASLSSEAECHESTGRRRRLRSWRDHDGAFRLDALLTPESGGMVLAALRPVTESLAREAKKQGCNVPLQAPAAEAHGGPR